MTDFHILVPTSTTNFITNPSVENSTDGWNAVGSAISRVLTRARFGRYSLKVVTTGAALYEGVYFRIDATGINSNMAGSIYVRGEGEVRLRLIDGFKGGQSVSKKISLNDTRWTRIDVVGRVGDSNDYRLYVETTSVQGITFYLDGAQLEAQSEVTSYCDGTMQGCRWNGVSHASSSYRSEEEMSGGIWTPIRDADCEPDTYVTVFGGFGMPPVNINRQRTALSPGSVFDNLTVDERVITLQIWVKDDQAQGRVGRSQLRIKELRQILTDLIKPDVSPNTEPFYLKVTDADGIGLILKSRYEGGLEFDSDVRDIWRNTIPLRLLCLDPFFEEDDQEVALVDTETIIAGNHASFARVNGEWEVCVNGFANVALTPIDFDCFEEDPNGRLYFGGTFVNDELGNQLRRFGSTNDDYSLIVERATGVDNQVLAIVAHPNGRIYLCGTFLNDNAGNPFARIAEYDPVADTFAALAGGIDDDVARCLFVAPNGNLYVGGDFTTVNGAPMNSIAFWDGAWHSVGNILAELGTAAYTIYTLYVESDNNIYAAGTCAEGYILIHWDGSGWSVLHTETPPGVGLNPVAFRLLKDNDGTYLHAGYVYTDAAGTRAGRLWRWNGSSYTQLGEDLEDTGANGQIFYMDLDPDGNLYVSGIFDTIGDLFFDDMALWNGSIFSPIDIYPNANYGPIGIRSNGDIYVGIGTSKRNVHAAGITYVNNISTTDAYPIIAFSGTGRILWLENQTTEQRVYFNYVLQENEILTIDFRLGAGSEIVTSNYRGRVPDAILPNSDDFFLAAGKIDQPKENKIACLIVDEVEPVVQLRYTPVHWSSDAGAG